jgi:peptidoglycan/xylan/chitin deacetylase (PgdA/CDA1 family)
MSKLSFTMSWDDGSPHDVRLADLLLKYNLKSTFYIPKYNIEGTSVVTNHEIRQLAQNFEIGAHTIDHIRLNTLSHEQRKYQIQGSKDWLEEIIGNSIYGFCYPGGVYNNYSIEAVKEAGFFYSRTIENFRNDVTHLYEMPTTIQFFNHKNYVLLSNILKSEDRLAKILNYHPILRTNNLMKRFEYILDYSINRNLTYIHFWGHSWELDQYGQWDLLEEFFKILQERSQSLSFKTNFQCALQHSKDCS